MIKRDRLLSIQKVAKILDVHMDTLRYWDADGKLLALRTPGGHRRYRQSDVDVFMGNRAKEKTEEFTTAIYCRVSSNEQKQKGDLERQIGRVSLHCAQKQYKVVSILQEVGSGMSSTRTKLQTLFKLVESKQICKVVVEHKDRLCRFNFGFLETYFISHGVVIEWLDDVLGKSYEEELVEDFLSLMSSFSARIYGKRSAENRKRTKESSMPLKEEKHIK